MHNTGHDEDDDEQRIILALKKIYDRLGEILVVDQEIRDLLIPSLTHVRLTTMPKTIDIGQTATATLQGMDQNGQPMAIDQSFSVVYSAANPNNVSFGQPNPDGSVIITGVAADPGDAISAVVTTPQGQTVTSSTDTLVINEAAAPVLTSVTLTLS